ncbi:MAG: Undecaprenyl-diphosphatase BcrC [Planctomycetota bacterium]
MSASRLEADALEQAAATASSSARLTPTVDLSLEAIASPETSSDHRRKRLWGAAVVLVILAIGALGIDLPIARYFHDAGERALPRSLQKLIILSEVFAHGTGVAFLLLVMWVLDRRHRRSVLRIACCAFCAGIAADLVKLSVARFRPYAHLPVTSIWESFVGWLPILAADVNGARFDSSMQSFPSAHTATGVGFAIGLSMQYPHGRWLFASLAVMAASQRVVVSAHYVSDCLMGAALACVLASFFHGPGRISHRLHLFESTRSF